MKRLSCPKHGTGPVMMTAQPGCNYMKHAICWVCFYEKMRAELPPLDVIEEPDEQFEHEERQRAWSWGR